MMLASLKLLVRAFMGVDRLMDSVSNFIAPGTIDSEAYVIGASRAILRAGSMAEVRLICKGNYS